MVELAFTIDKDSDFYNRYFKCKNEKQKFHEYARKFFEKHNLLQNMNYYIRENLGLQLTDEQEQQFASQLKKYKDDNGISEFKKNSPMQKEWIVDVVNQVDMNILRSMDFWYWGYINFGKYSLWDNNEGDIYGYLCDNQKSEIKLSDYMMPIKMSQYYMAKEKCIEKRSI